MKYLWLILVLLFIPAAGSAAIEWNNQYGISNFKSLDRNSSDAYVVAGNTIGTVYAVAANGTELWNLSVAPDTINYIKATNNLILAANTSTAFAINTAGVLQWSRKNATFTGPILGIDAIQNSSEIIVTEKNFTWMFDSSGTLLYALKPYVLSSSWAWNNTIGCKISPDGTGVFCQQYGWIPLATCGGGAGYFETLVSYAYPSSLVPVEMHVCGDVYAIGGPITVSSESTRVVHDKWNLHRVYTWSGTTLALVSTYTSSLADYTATSNAATSTVASNTIVGRGVVVEIVNSAGQLLGYDSTGGTIYSVDMDTSGVFACAGGLDGKMRLYNKNTTTAWVNVFTDGAREVIYGTRITTDGEYAYAARATGYITKYSVPLSVSSQSFQLYNPHYVRFTVVDQFNAPMPNVNITAVGVMTTTSSWDWLKGLLAIPLDTIPIQNTSMIGETDSMGSATFLMFESVQYFMGFVNSKGESTTARLYPLESSYVIHFYPNQSYASSPAETANLSGLCTVWGASTDSTLNLSIFYNDTSSHTTNVTAFLYAPMNATYLPGKAWLNTNLVIDNFTIPNEWGGAYQWGVYAIKTNGENVSPVACGITTKGPSGVMVDLGLPSPLYYLWLSFILLLLIGGIFTSERLTVFGMVLVPAMAGFFYWFGWITSTSAGAVIVIIGFLGAFAYMKWRHRQLYGTGAAGSTAINIIIFMVLLQLSVGFVNIMPVWGTTPGGFAPTVSNNTYTTTWTVSQISSSTQGIVPSAGGVGTALLLGVTMVWNAIVFLASFIVAPYTLMTWAFGAFGVSGSPMANYISVMFGFGWWVAIMLLLFNIVYKPPLGTVDAV